MIALLAVTLALGPWTGPSLATAGASATKYSLTVRGTAGQRVDLRAERVPDGYVASFCTPSLCSPFAYTMQLDGRGTAKIEFQVIRTDDRAPKHTSVIVTAAGAKPVEVRV